MVRGASSGAVRGRAVIDAEARQLANEPSARRGPPLGSRAVSVAVAPLGRDTALLIANRLLIAASVIAFGVGLAFGFEIAVIVIAVLGWALVLTLPRSPKVGLLGLFILCAVDPAMRVYVFVPLDLPHNTFNYLLLIIALTSLTALSRHVDARVGLLAVFSGFLALWIPISSNRFLGLQNTFEVVASFGLIGAFFRAGLDDRFLGKAVIGIGTATACLTLVHYVRPPDLPINVNALVQVPFMGMATAALAVARPAPRNWLVLGLLVMLNFGLAFITSSRGGFMSASLLALFILWRTPSFRWKTFSMAAAVIALVAAATLFTDLYTASMEKWGEFMDPTLSASQSTHRRSDIAEFGWTTFIQNPFGTGTGSFANQNAAAGLHSRGFAAHSAWIKTLTENGLPGLILLVSFVVSFAVARPSSPDVTRAIGPLTAITMSIVFITSEFQSKGLWVLIAGTIVLLQLRRRPVSLRDGSGSTLRRGVIRPRADRNS